jgi:hypothetical protein
MKAPKILFLTVLIIAVYVLHQDFWNWKQADPLVFGFLPIGLAYHAGYSIVAAILMAILVKLAWPRHLEDVQPKEPENSAKRTEGH